MQSHPILDFLFGFFSTFVLLLFFSLIFFEPSILIKGDFHVPMCAVQCVCVRLQNYNVDAIQFTHLEIIFCLRRTITNFEFDILLQLACTSTRIYSASDTVIMQKIVSQEASSCRLQFDILAFFAPCVCVCVPVHYVRDNRQVTVVHEKQNEPLDGMMTEKTAIAGSSIISKQHELLNKVDTFAFLCSNFPAQEIEPDSSLFGRTSPFTIAGIRLQPKKIALRDK